MPRQAIVYVVLIFIGAILGVYFSARLLNTEKSWADALAKVRQSNETSAGQLTSERAKLRGLETDVDLANLGWDRWWNNVGTTPNRQARTLAIQIGSAQGLAARGNTPPVLHAFQPVQGGGYKYIGPFVVQNILNDSSRLIAAWEPIRDQQGRPDPWVAGQWRFRTQIPAQFKVMFDGLTARFATDEQTRRETMQSIAKQDDLFNAANAQLDLRTTELQGSQDPDVEVDPLRPELSKGLVTAIEDEEEARNTLQLEVDALRRAILDAKQLNASYLQTIQQSATPTTGATQIGSRPE